MNRRKKKRPKSKKDLPPLADHHSLELLPDKEEKCRRRSASGLAASLVATRFTKKRESEPDNISLRERKRRHKSCATAGVTLKEEATIERKSTAQIILMNNALKHITSSKQSGSESIASISKELFEYSKTVEIIDSTSFYLQFLKTCAKAFLNIEQLDSSLSRNLNRKMLTPLCENLEICSEDPKEFFSHIAASVQVWNSYFRLSRHSFNELSQELITARSYWANLAGSEPSNYKGTGYSIGRAVKVPFADIAFCGSVHIQTEKITQWDKVWLVVIWKNILCYSNRQSDILIDHISLENALVKLVSYDEGKLNVTLPSRSVSILVESSKGAEQLHVIIDSCIMKYPANTSALVFTATRMPFTIVQCKFTKKTKDIPSSVEEFLSLGNHEKPWRLLFSGDESILHWISKPNKLEKLIQYLYMIPTEWNKKESQSDDSSTDHTSPRKLKKSSHKSSQEAFAKLAATTQQQEFYSQQALAVLTCEQIMKYVICHTDIVHKIFNILVTPKPYQINNFVEIASKLMKHHPDTLFYYLITFPDSVCDLVSQISNTTILKFLLSLWNCTPHTTVQLNALDQIGQEILHQFLDSEYSLISESIGHQIVFLQVLIRRLHAVKLKTARGIFVKHHWNPIYFGVNRDRMRHLKVDIEQALQLQFRDESSNSPANSATMNTKDSKIQKSGKPLDDILASITPPTSSPETEPADFDQKPANDFFQILNDKEIARKLVKKSLNALNIQTRVKTLQLLATLVRHTQKRVTFKDIPTFITQIVAHASQFQRTLQNLPVSPAGFYRLSIIQLFRWLVSIRNTTFATNLLQESLLQMIIDYIFIYPDNVFLLTEIDGMIQSICHNPPEVCKIVLNDQFFQKLQELNETTVTPTNTLPCVTKICTTLYQQRKRFPEINWDEFVKLWNVTTEERCAVQFTRTKQLADHWDDFHFLFSSF